MKSAAIAKLLRAAGIAPRQYSTLCDLYKKLGERQEFEIGNAQALINKTSWICGALGIIPNWIAVANGVALERYVFDNLAITCFLSVSILATEVINKLIHPVDASALAHQPISDTTYFAAKVTRFAALVPRIVFPISIVPSLAGLYLNGARWFYPATYLLSVYLLGLFVVAAQCGILGLLIRIVPLARVRKSVLWAQISIMSLIGFFPFVSMALGRVRLDRILSSSALPLNWFVTLTLAGSRGNPPLAVWPMAVSLILTAVVIGFGIRFLLRGYLTRVHVLLRTGPSRQQARTGEWMGSVGRFITRRPSERAGFAFIQSIARADWQFRGSVYPMSAFILALPIVGLIGTGLGHSPFSPGRPTFANFIPHMTGIVGLIACWMISYSNQHRAAWIFLTVPLEGVRSFLRGVLLALLFRAGVVIGLVLPILTWYWGILDASLFAIYWLAIASCYLSAELFLVKGLPFANPPTTYHGAMMAPLGAAIVTAIVLSGLQWLFIFQDRLVTIGTTLALGASAHLIAKASLRNLEVNVIQNLHRIALGRTTLVHGD